MCVCVCVCVCVCACVRVCVCSDDHRANKPEAAARPSEGAVLPTSVHSGAGAHRRPAAPGVVGTCLHSQQGRRLLLKGQGQGRVTSVKYSGGHFRFNPNLTTCLVCLKASTRD